MTLMAQGAKQDFILHFATQLMLQLWFPVKNKVQSMFTPISISDKNTRELRKDINPKDITKQLEFSRFFGLLILGQKTFEKVGEKQSIISLSM